MFNYEGEGRGGWGFGDVMGMPEQAGMVSLDGRPDSLSLHHTHSNTKILTHTHTLTDSCPLKDSNTVSDTHTHSVADTHTLCGRHTHRALLSLKPPFLLFQPWPQSRARSAICFWQMQRQFPLMLSPGTLRCC